MIFLIHSETATNSIAANLGLSEYSYYFVLKEFRPVLEEFGLVLPVSDPANEVDRIWANAASHGEEALFLTFSPPHKTYCAARCPTIPVFAWEFDTLPSEVWDSNPHHDWRHVLRRTGRAITHSQFSVETVLQAMGPDYPVVSAPAPVWDRFAGLYRNRPQDRTPVKSARLKVRGRVFDSRQIDFAPLRPAALRQHAAMLPPLPGGAEHDQEILLDGVVYTSVFCPSDGRKNWFDMICAFVWCFREVEDATLVLKLTKRNADTEVLDILKDLAKLPPFRCRVVILDAFLDDDAYMGLAAASTYAVNSSHGEGQCLPLMEYMSAGKPAVAPAHTSMADYIRPDNGFIVASHLEPASWPHDPRQAFRTRRHRIDFESLVAAYGDSYRVAKAEPQRYRHMGDNAFETLRGHCSADRLRRIIRDFVIPAAGPAATVDPVLCEMVAN